ncbi:hypothetical protein [Sphingomonas sp. Leaf242]|uniref:hypothetical protein n=1 Tax=Sphingomonas sp. Leaf242 TaxID=1736304 RepID=UPI000714B6BB|nr:hypothetical protein [Sphingomonas sp. Leaf242]KQO06925.1 hypothetical protein ASF09_11735 [Sphingomonas sp. Leaf242]
MKTIDIDRDHSAYDSFETMWFEEIGRVIEEEADKITPPPPSGFDVWDARKRRKIVRGSGNDHTIKHSLHRAKDAWRVYQTREIKNAHFSAVVEEWLQWPYDPEKPFPHDSYEPDTGSIWDELDGECVSWTIKGSLTHFLVFADLERDTAMAIIEQCEDDGEIDAIEATMARLSI